jgi:glycosyltransferase involved in cell wall biosynthesis
MPTYNRRKFIPAAIRCFMAQTYERRELVVLDDGTDSVADLFAPEVLPKGIVVRYIRVEGKMKIGAKRNRLIVEARGDIICWQDDDDFYPPDRVKKAVNKLRSVPNRQVPVVGSSRLVIYFSDRDEIWTIGPYGKNHCTNGTMAHWKSYGLEHKYDETVDMAEEKSFLENWTTPVLQLVSEECMLVIAHADNTYDKRKLLKQNNPTLRKMDIKMRALVRDPVLRAFYLGLAKDYVESV